MVANMSKVNMKGMVISMDFETICIHGNERNYDVVGAVPVPIFTSATFTHPGLGQEAEFEYSRLKNPTREHFECIVAALEGGKYGLAFSSGLAATSALMELFSPGDHIVAADDLYGGSHRLFTLISQKNGVCFTFADTAEKIISAIKPNTKAVFIETPSNPMMMVIDIAAVAKETKKRGILLIVDNTFMTPYLQKPLELGADIVLHSATKYLSGHHDVLAGVLVLSDDEINERLRTVSKTIGSVLSPFDSYLAIRGIKTLPIRMERHQETTKILAEWLKSRTEIKSVHYIGFENHPGYEITCRQSSGFGGILSFTMKDEETTKKLLEGIKIIKFAPSLGGVESLLTYPMLQTHGDIPEEERLDRGINPCLVRLAVGLESAKDLIADISAALCS